MTLFGDSECDWVGRVKITVAVTVCSFVALGTGAQPAVSAEKSAADGKALGARLEKIAKAAGFNGSEIGIWISDGETMIYGKHETKSFIPASVSKIATAGAVLSVLPQGHKFKTLLVADSKTPGLGADGRVAGGTLKGNLFLVGGGDPAFVSENMWFLVNELTRTGVNEVEGDLVVDDTRFDAVRFGEDRQDQRVDRAYDAPVGAMSLNWNSVTGWVRPAAEAGAAAHVVLDVASPFVKLENKTKTVAAGKPNAVAIERLASKDTRKQETFLASGTIGLGQPEKAIYKSIREPDIWSGQSALAFLEQRGIKVKGTVRTGGAPESAVVLAVAESKPIHLIVADMLKWSNNYVAEMLVKNLAAESGEKPATMATGMKRVREWIEKSTGIKRADYDFVNAAGFTRKSNLTPTQMGLVLNAIRREFRIFPEFLSALPIAGIDGTLRNRFKGQEGVGWIRAKTGLLNGAVGLAGFAGDERGKVLTFVFMFNGTAGKEEGARSTFDRMASALVKSL